MHINYWKNNFGIIWNKFGIIGIIPIIPIMLLEEDFSMKILYNLGKQRKIEIRKMGHITGNIVFKLPKLSGLSSGSFNQSDNH